MWLLISPLELLSSIFPHVIVLQRTVSFKFCLHLHTVYVCIIYEKTKGKFPCDLHWENKTYKLYKSIISQIFEMGLTIKFSFIGKKIQFLTRRGYTPWLHNFLKFIKRSVGCYEACCKQSDVRIMVSFFNSL